MRIALALSVSALVIAANIYGQRPDSLDNRLSGILARMTSPDLRIREAAFNDLQTAISQDQKQADDYPDALAAFLARHLDEADRIKVGLINLLRSDNDLFVNSGAPRNASYTEDDSEHYARVIEAVVALDDERAIPSLVGAMSTGGIASRGLLRYGEKALGPVMDQLNVPDPLIRSSAVSVAAAILRTMTDAAAHAQMLALIQDALADPEFLVRSAAVYAIDNLSWDRRQFAPVLEKIARQDPFIAPGQTDYPLRVRAKKLLESIGTH